MRVLASLQSISVLVGVIACGGPPRPPGRAATAGGRAPITSDDAAPLCAASPCVPERWTDETVALRAGVTEPRPVPRGVADANGAILYVRGADDALVALDLHDGHVRWRSTAAQLPVLGLRGGVVALAVTATSGRYVVLDAGGQQLAASAGFVMPVHDRADAVAERLDGSTLRIALTSWREQQRTGAEQRLPPMPPPVETAQTFDLATGIVTSAPMTSPAAVALPAGNDALALFRDARGRAQAWRSGDRIAALVVVHAAGGDSLELRTWDPVSGRALLAKPLVASIPPPGYLVQMASADGAHVFLIRCNDQPEDGKPAGAICRWHVFAVATGDEIVTAAVEPGVAEVAIVGDRFLSRILRPSPQSGARGANPLVARDVKTGEAAWEFAVSGTEISSIP
jgi:hypothetical protein